MMLFFDNEFFPWEGLPYPYEHAKQGVKLVQQGRIDEARQMADFHQVMLDHNSKPIFSFFRQNHGCNRFDLEMITDEFFSLVDFTPKVEYNFVDDKLGIILNRTLDSTMIGFGSGCKSGMGVFLVNKSGIVNFGIQLKPVGECEGFGLAGRGKNIEASDNSLKYQCRLAAPHARNTGIPGLQDSGYCGMWINSTYKFEQNLFNVKSQIDGLNHFSKFCFSFFGKASTCIVAGSHRLQPCSLDRYMGPPEVVALEDVKILPESGFKSMEVIPLAGDESFWGANFLISFSLASNCFDFSLTKK